MYATWSPFFNWRDSAPRTDGQVKVMPQTRSTNAYDQDRGREIIVMEYLVTEERNMDSQLCKVATRVECARSLRMKPQGKGPWAGGVDMGIRFQGLPNLGPIVDSPEPDAIKGPVQSTGCFSSGKTV